MKPFQFRGERILEWRRAMAGTARGEFLRAAESVREALHLAHEADARAAQASRAAVDALCEAVDVGTIERHRIWIGQEQRHADRARLAHQERQGAADEKAAVLQLANRHVKVMERLRERAQQRYRDLERQLEFKALNELATMQFTRRRAEEGVERDH